MATVAAIVGGMLALAGCGGTSTLSHTQLAAKAGSACRTANETAAHLSAPAQTYASLNHYALGLSPIVHTLIGKLAALKARSADRAALQSYITALRSGDQGLGMLASASSAAQVTQARTVLASQSLSTRAGALGAPACGAAPPVLEPPVAAPLGGGSPGAR